jgi:threonine/homoserine/homoserine lactone efflux protein
MPSTAAFLSFLTALFFLEISPGPDMMLVLARGVGQGRKIAVFTVLGIVFVSGVVQLGLLILGVASLLQSHPVSLVVLRWIGAAYLFYLGAKMIQASKSGLKKPATASVSSPGQALWQGAINNLTNPKSFLFMFAFLPQFVDPASGPVWLQLLLFGSMQKLAGIVSLGTVALASGTLGQWLFRRPDFLIWQRRFTGLVMMGLGLGLLLNNGIIISSSSAHPGIHAAHAAYLLQ